MRHGRITRLGSPHPKQRATQMACEGCDWLTDGETADELQAAMMTHGDEAHADHFHGETPDEIRAMKELMDGHVRQMSVDQN